MTAFVAMVRVSMRQLLGRKWVILVGLVGLLPMVVMLVRRGALGGGMLGAEFSRAPLMILFWFVLPLTSILLGSLALGEERREGTLSFLILRPRAREVVIGAKLLAAWAGAWLIAGLSGILAAAASGSAGTLFPVVAATGIATLAYTSVFLAVGYATRWAVLIGAGFLFFWENGIAFAADSLANVSLYRIGLTAYASLAPTGSSTLDDALGALQPGAIGASVKVVVLAALGIGAVSLLMRRRDLT